MYLIVFISTIVCLTTTSVNCQTPTTAVVFLHGRGESANAGNGDHFVTRFQALLTNRSITTYNVLNIGLSNNSNDDQNWSSYRDMGFQSEKFCQQLNEKQVWNQLTAAERIVLVGFSQGGL